MARTLRWIDVADAVVNEHCVESLLGERLFEEGATTASPMCW